jgi:hypothetical protein
LCLAFGELHPSFAGLGFFELGLTGRVLQDHLYQSTG